MKTVYLFPRGGIWTTTIAFIVTQLQSSYVVLKISMFKQINPSTLKNIYRDIDNIYIIIYLIA